MNYELHFCHNNMKKGDNPMNEILKQIGAIGIVPTLKVNDAKDAAPFAKALKDGSLPIVEVTFRTAAAEQGIRNITAELPEILVGAGTILSVQQAETAIKAGAKFIVSPGVNREVIKYCVDRDVLMIPGCSNPTDMETAIGFGLKVVKFFPAEAFGGLKTLKAIGPVYGDLKFIPMGGINPDNLNEYLAYEKVVACGGSWLDKGALIKEGKFEEITRLAKEAVNTVLGFELAHVGINAPDENSSLHIATQFANLFNFTLKPGSSSNFAGNGIEVNKGMGLGRNGHIAVKTNSITRAVAYLERTGVKVDMSTAKTSPDGSLFAVYLQEEICGFAVHLVQKKL
jgi:2-dehydro-3-deoxyphosphogluconate aldolase/(4S)-4-hydroxy-2-oxoglutarate aldolase